LLGESKYGESEINTIGEQNVFDANILVVNDIATNVLLLAQMLSEAGYQRGHFNYGALSRCGIASLLTIST